MVELQFNYPIKSVQSDGGGEFRPFTKYLNDLGIVHKFTCLHTHHQNGIVERKHRHIVETGLALLAQSILPLKFWDHSFVTAAYLINRLPSVSLNNQSLYFKLLNKQPDYSCLRVFGCSCFPFLRPYNSHKLDYRSQECIFLGYSTAHKGYKCLAPNGHIYISKDVLFQESKFPYSTLFHTIPSSVPTKSSTTSFFTVPLMSPTPIHQVSPEPSTSATPISSAPTDAASNGSPNTVPEPNNLSEQSPILSSSPNTSSHNSTSAPELITSDLAEASTISPSSSPAMSPTTSPSSSPNPQPFINPLNTHPMQTRAKSGIVKPKLNPTLLLTHLEPTSVGQALAAPHWYQAMKEEY